MFRPNEAMNLKSANDIWCITKRRKYCLKNLQQSRQSPRLLIEYFSVLTTKTFNNLDVLDLIFFFHRANLAKEDVTFCFHSSIYSYINKTETKYIYYIGTIPHKRDLKCCFNAKILWKNAVSIIKPVHLVLSHLSYSPVTFLNWEIDEEIIDCKLYFQISIH